jgi:hypothetical protein
VTYRQVSDRMIGFIGNLYTPLGTTGNYSGIAISTLYSSPLHTFQCPQSVTLSPIPFLATDS